MYSWRGAEHGKRSGGVLVAAAAGHGDILIPFLQHKVTDFTARRGAERAGPEALSAFAFRQWNEGLRSGMADGAEFLPNHLRGNVELFGGRSIEVTLGGALLIRVPTFTAITCSEPSIRRTVSFTKSSSRLLLILLMNSRGPFSARPSSYGTTSPTCKFVRLI